jgi:transglutaminase-like putative cysteine protease
MVITLLDNPLKVNFEGVLRTDADFKMRSFKSELKSAGHEIRIDGEREGDTLSLSVLSGDRVFRKESKMGADLNLSNTLTPLLYLPNLEPGVTYSLDILDPLSFSTNRAKITIAGMETFEYGGKEIEVYVVETEYEGLAFTAWVTESGDVLKEATPLGWTLLREDRDVARDFRADAGAFTHDVAKLVSVASDVRIEEPEKTRKSEIYITGVDLSLFSLEGAGQRLIDPETGLIRIEKRRPDAGRSLPIPMTDDSLAEFLAESLLIQSEDSRIREMAARIAGDETNSLIVAERINQWVFDNVRKKITFSLPSAVEVLDSREGDCNEHTTLYVALARAAGVPSKIAIGLVYHKGSFYYHAWPEVYVGEWIAMDPTFGQPVADATHIKLLEGELDQQAKLMRAIGKIKLSVKSISYPPPTGGAAS